MTNETKITESNDLDDPPQDVHEGIRVIWPSFSEKQKQALKTWAEAVAHEKEVTDMLHWED